MNPKSWSALQLGKAINQILKKSGRGGTSAPGYYALKLDRNLLGELAKELDQVIIITGTNGKTTTSRLLSNILTENGVRVLHNRAGSNLTRGLVSTLISQSQKSKTVAVFEVDEATIPEVLEQITPHYLIVNNLFRDQLDRYGEVSKIHTLWKKSLASLPPSSMVILNSDDPNVADLGRNLSAQVSYFGLQDKSVATQKAPHTIDARVCPLDGKPLKYEYYYLSHLGGYHCSGHDFKRPDPQISAEKIATQSVAVTNFTINCYNHRVVVNLPISGLYNIYNALGAAATASAMGLSQDAIKKGLENFEAAFGRQQTLTMEGKKLNLNLVKNPVGYNEVLRLLQTEKDLHLLLILNDNLADGTDVSWIWDVDFENLKNKAVNITVSGNRALELANRLKYAEIFRGEILVEPTINKGLQTALRNTNQGSTVYALPTYTAMLQLQKILTKQGVTKAFWES